MEWREHIRDAERPGGPGRAAMEPAVEWREHGRRRPRGIDERIGPQWSPPWNGGNTVLATAADDDVIAPQWSPPWNGGNTRPNSAGVSSRCIAAMEPAVEWREHENEKASLRPLADAAMEPALEWREHPVSAPPSTPSRSAAAMEPALEWREHLAAGHEQAAALVRPQWSPPWNGGNTLGYVQVRFRDDLPQWSPPLEWREHAVTITSRPGDESCRRNGARLGMAGTRSRQSRRSTAQVRRNGARLGMAGTRLARFGPCELGGCGVARAVWMSVAPGIHSLDLSRCKNAR